jgi:DNA repair exonuclease SbcCD nuclease subunit
VRILHLSDLHFGMRLVDEKDENDRPIQRLRSTHAFVAHGRPDPHRLADVLSRDLRSDRIDPVVVSGDLGWAGKAEDYSPAEECLRLVQEQLSAPIVIAPGNHDYDRDIGNGKDPGDPQGAFVDFLRRLYGNTFDGRFPFYDLDTASPSPPSATCLRGVERK